MEILVAARRSVYKNRMQRASSEEKIKAARFLCETSSWPELLDLAQAWQEKFPDDAKAHFYRGLALAGTRRFAEAETSYRRALELEPKDFKAWNNLAGILFGSMNKPMDALRCMEQATKVEPENKLGWSNLASMVGRLGRHEKALEFAERALALDPQMVEAHLHRAAAAKSLGKMEVVREVAETLASIEEKNFRRAR